MRIAANARETARDWLTLAMEKMRADQARTPETHLRVFPLPPDWGIDVYLKDESVHPTGSLKHRLAHSLILFGLANGDIESTTTLVEASSGSTAVSEAYFASIIGLPFVAVVPSGTSVAKIDLIERYGGQCRIVENAAEMYETAERLGAQVGWHYLDQFTNAALVTDWRGNNGIADSIFRQMREERFPAPSWIVVGAGTGGTSATMGRYCRYWQQSTRVAVVDPEGSVFYDAWRYGRRDFTATGSRIEGIGRPRVEPSFIPGVIDEVVRISDSRSIAAAWFLKEVTGLHGGASTGTNLAGVLEIAQRMRSAGERGSIVSLICDRGDRYDDTYYSPEWLLRQGISIDADLGSMRRFLNLP
jgi:cysteine synthase